MVRGHMMYGSPYRNYNRGGRGGGGGFGRGQPRRFQSPPPQPVPPRKGDVFEEAGRLAAEYLVTKGLLPPDALSGNWQNGSFKNQGFQNGMAHEGDNLLDRRMFGANIDYGGGRRRLGDDFNSRDYVKGRNRTGSFKDYGSEDNREFGRSGSWSEKQAGSDGGNEEKKLLPRSELVPKHGDTGNSESEFEKNQVVENVGSNASSSSTAANDIPPEAAMVSTESGDGMNLSNGGSDEAMEDGSNDKLEKENTPEDSMIQQRAEEDDHGNSGGSDLLALSGFAKMPTRTRSSLASRGSRVDPVLIAEDDPNESELSRDSGGPVEDVCKDVSLGDDASLTKSPSLNFSEPSETSTEQGARQLGLEYKVGQGLCTRSNSFPERASMSGVHSSERSLGFGKSSSMIIDRGEKRALLQSDSGEGAKRIREWKPLDSCAEDFVHLSNSMEKKQASHTHEEMLSSEEDILGGDQQKMMDMSMYPNSGNDPCIEHVEEKQLFPGSFKICDLNLMQSSDNHDTDPLLMFQSSSQIKKEADAVDIDLSMSSIGNSNDKNGMRGADGKEVEVIDLESDSIQEDNAYNNAERKDTLFTGLESFPDQAHNVNGIPDGQDGYGLMISELLGADIPNCSPVQPGINSLHNEMDMHNGEGMLGDDDSIYMSLGEIPISFMGVWDQQPAQEYEKPF